MFLNGNYIQVISLCFNSDISKEFDFNRIVIRNLRLEEVKTKNPDFETVSAILKDIPDSCKVLLNLKSSFEIELQSKKYYTIVDMEDGNYIATNTECSIFRLLHDHEQPIKLIFEDIEEFCKIYIGEKENLSQY